MDHKALVYKGYPPDHCCCDSTLRILPDGEFAAFSMTGGPGEPNSQVFPPLASSILSIWPVQAQPLLSGCSPEEPDYKGNAGYVA